MYDWLGFKMGYPLQKSWKLNKHLKKDVERTFEGISETRKQLLIDWTTETWNSLDRLSHQLLEKLRIEPLQQSTVEITNLINDAYKQSIDFTELFVLSPQYVTVASTYAAHLQTSYKENQLFVQALQYMESQNWHEPLLFGPYCDVRTLEIGARSSSFHDSVTLMFFQPLMIDGQLSAILCGRIPNDVIGDLIQREAGHVYPDSGDNYLFMAKPRLLIDIEPGVALSRSRFEDKTFSMGENLKDGVTTNWGVVSVKEHTELELKFISPATKELHPGVANTIENGENLFVEFPAYPDYRYIPVIGKGCTFQLPHCPDVWGMMCEGDFEEVYRTRSIGTNRRIITSVGAICIALLSFLIIGIVGTKLSPWIAGGLIAFIQLVVGLGVIRHFVKKDDNREIKQILKVKKFIQTNAEGKGDLTKRLGLSQFNNDEIKDIAKWLNNMMDSLEGIMLQVKHAAHQVSNQQLAMNETAANTTTSTKKVSHQVSEMIGSIYTQLEDIEQVREMADTMRETLNVIEQRAASQISVAQSEVDRIGDKMHQISSKVTETNDSIHSFVKTMQDIKNIIAVIEDISAQTQLLALNASIEAAHVGEQGSGFAVVAGEIRKLATSTKRSTAEVYEITDRIYKQAKKAYKIMDEGNDVVEEGNQLVQTVSETLYQAGIEDVRKSELVEQVVTLLEQIAQVSTKNRKVSSSVEKRVHTLADEMIGVQASSKQVEAITSQLEQLVSQFKLTPTRIR